MKALKAMTAAVLVMMGLCAVLLCAPAQESVNQDSAVLKDFEKRVAGQTIRRRWPSLNDTSGRTSVKSKNSSGSISANGSAPHCRAR